MLKVSQIILLIIFILLTNIALCQQTFSRLIFAENSDINEFTDFEILNNNIYISSFNICKSDTNPNHEKICTSITKCNQNGIVNSVYTINSLTPYGLDKLTISDSKVLISGHWSGPLPGRSNILIQFTENLLVDSIFEFSSKSDIIPNNEGVFRDSANYFLYGSDYNTTEEKSLSSILCIDGFSKEIIWQRKYARGRFINKCFDLQPFQNNEFIFIHRFRDGIGPNSQNGVQIKKLDASGIPKDSFEFEEVDIETPRLLVGIEQELYFASQNPPYTHTIPSLGRINRIESALDSVTWSLQLPSDPFINGHSYKIADLILADNGDIVACGSVWEEGPDGPIENVQDHSWNGFICRVTTSGELKWLKVYRHPNIQPSLPTDQFGKYLSSGLIKLMEAEDGHLITVGTVYFNTIQENELNDDDIKSWGWILRVDSIGCIEGEECKNVIVIDGSNSLLLDYKIGTKWTYELSDVLGPYYSVSAQTFEITDTITYSGREVFVIENNRNNTKEYMYVDGLKYYFYDVSLNDFQLSYDFSSPELYESNWVGNCDLNSSGIAKIIIDSIGSIATAGLTIKNQYITISQNGTLDEDLNRNVYVSIGPSYGGLRLPLGRALCDFKPSTTRIRCFENDTFHLNFVNFNCDSSYLSTKTGEILENKLSLYPNPNQGRVYIDNKIDTGVYELYSLLGVRLLTGLINNNVIEIPFSGHFILRVLYENEIYVNKIITLDY